MPTSPIRANRLALRLSALVALMIIVSAAAVTPPALALMGTDAEPSPGGAWTWPVDGPREVTEPFLAPAHEYGPGHRGVDITAAAGTTVRAPAPGVVAFRGVVVDRPLITIDHGGGLVSTFEPVESELTAGTVLEAGTTIGTVATGGHADAGTMHIGVRLNGDYINPMLMFGDVPRAILLPCCGAITRAGAPVGRSQRASLTIRGYRSGSSRDWRARGSPARRADRLPRRAGALRRSAATREGPRPPPR